LNALLKFSLKNGEFFTDRYMFEHFIRACCVEQVGFSASKASIASRSGTAAGYVACGRDTGCSPLRSVQKGSSVSYVARESGSFLIVDLKLLSVYLQLKQSF
jgi:hypothetical protein